MTESTGRSTGCTGAVWRCRATGLLAHSTHVSPDGGLSRRGLSLLSAGHLRATDVATTRMSASARLALQMMTVMALDVMLRNLDAAERTQLDVLRTDCDHQVSLCERDEECMEQLTSILATGDTPRPEETHAGVREVLVCSRKAQMLNGVRDACFETYSACEAKMGCKEELLNAMSSK
eukprot:COSAG02_NODE_3727_length_6315_cov_20.568694_7_plen_177_part_01